jgi:hypothetical protein
VRGSCNVLLNSLLQGTLLRTQSLARAHRRARRMHPWPELTGVRGVRRADAWSACCIVVQRVVQRGRATHAATAEAAKMTEWVLIVLRGTPQSVVFIPQSVVFISTHHVVTRCCACTLGQSSPAYAV